MSGTTETLVIGASASGMATAAELRRQGLEAEIVESGDFRCRVVASALQPSPSAYSEVLFGASRSARAQELAGISRSGSGRRIPGARVTSSYSPVKRNSACQGPSE
jgi:2-polyprenyl-6-methoxyphenol hydroxylase-like FAD-dependent oxidoreductase